MRSVGLLALLAVLSIPVLSHAQEASFNGFQKDDWTLSLNGGGANDKNFDDVAFNLSLSLSRFVTDSFEIGLTQNAAYQDGFNGLTAIFANYNFRLENPKFVPYIGANIGYSYGEDIEDIFRGGPQVGLKYFVNTTTYVYGQMSYLMDLEDFDNGAFAYGIGIGFRF